MNKKGFLLFEVLLSIVIVSVALLFIMRAYSHSKDSMEISRDLLRAGLLLGSKLWEFEDTGEIEEGVKTGDFPGDERYSWSIESLRIENSDLNLVELELFPKRDRKDRRYSILTYLKNKPE